MKVILIKNVPNLGKTNAVVDVKEGYAKNYLIKNKLAIVYNDTNKKELDKKLIDINAQHDLLLAQAVVLKNQLEKLELNFILQMNANNKAFGSINNKQILDELKLKNIEIDKVMLPDNLKLSLGFHKIKIKIFENVEAMLQINVKGD
ncbi:50S ribosomal protein L9 [Mycoplasmoides pirum]|uniref:50S ribosomal protein L9 n=1 Tax=Mycoplasmoides pirum TaxID=2122 RepID=UPI000488DBD0|nr:50S ribosomal protein L9 [Mycoplasmoides pirum]